MYHPVKIRNIVLKRAIAWGLLAEGGMKHTTAGFAVCEKKRKKIVP
jgi:hypothetical protein